MRYRIARAPDGSVFVLKDDRYLRLWTQWDDLFTVEDPFNLLQQSLASAQDVAASTFGAPISPSQEVWAFGVTYKSSEMARRAESQGGGDFYAAVYTAERPEAFFKATSRRVAGHGMPIRIRRDSRWNVPEPELALAVNAHGRIIGYTVGNDMSSRSIEGENPLYLPQAKVWKYSCALGPELVLTNEPLGGETRITLDISRAGAGVFNGSTTVGAMKRTPAELVPWLFAEDEHPHGVLALTGTGVVPPDEFTLQVGDIVSITIEGLGTLTNPVHSKGAA